MRKTLIIIFGTILLFACNSKQNIENLEKRNENWCWFINEQTGKGEWIPIGDKTTVKDGEYTLFFCNGEKRQKGRLKNGEDCDTIFYFDIQGKFISKVFQNDFGELQEIMKEGKYKSYYASCELSSKGEFKNSEQIGTRTEFYIDGKTKFQSTPINDTTWLFLEFSENGQLIDSSTTINGELDGISKHWFSNGELESIENFKQGMRNGICKWFYENGQIEAVCNFTDDNENGMYTSFFKDGTLKVKGLLVNDKEEGAILHYYENGQLESKANYLNGELNGETWFYHPNGQLEMHSMSEYGVTTQYKWYDKDGILEKEYDGNETIEY